MKRTGFTLIELLIVVAIIAILAAIAVPNFLEAQIRGKFARAVSDMRTLATAVESYAVDHNRYPPNNKVNFWSTPFQITTPLAYLTSGRLKDPFANWKRRTVGAIPGSMPDDAELYSYHKMSSIDEYMYLHSTRPEWEPPVEAVDSPGFNEGAFELYGSWKQISLGPDRMFLDESKSDIENLNLKLFDIHYDPTNGSTSFGNIYRTQKSTTGDFRRN
ncbi:MAG TPA: prepilin-type N-terminal cleavage/methylation domain-containing protein [Candidatus Sumerlaeota bacterium]|nr:prepilin-type N-terminal cleavage/methylation domain-containing protein [Candidatus Sumerlaeota bacterium]